MRSHVPALLGTAGLITGFWLTACDSAQTSNRPSPVSEPASTSAPTTDGPALRTARAATGWYEGKVEYGGKECTFWWWKPTTDVPHTIIAASLSCLPSSAPGKDGIEHLPGAGDVPEVEYCKVGPDGNEVSILHNGFMYVEADYKKFDSMNAAEKSRIIPWPIIVRTPSHPGGAYAGIRRYILLAMDDNTELGIAREGFFRPNQSASVDCADIAQVANDERLLALDIVSPAVEGGKPVPKVYDYSLKLQTVSEFNHLTDEAKNTADTRVMLTATASREAVFMIDACAFAKKAREAADGMQNPVDAPVTPCK